MTILIPIAICLAIFGAYLWHRKNSRARLLMIEASAPKQTLQDELKALAARLQLEIDALAEAGDAYYGNTTRVLCKSGHHHLFDEFVRNDSNDSVPDRGLWVDRHNLAFWDENFGYNGPKHQHLTPGQGLGWVPTSFGCPECHERDFKFEDNSLMAFTTCGKHLVRRGMDECPICAAIDRSAREEMQLRIRFGSAGQKRAS